MTFATMLTRVQDRIRGYGNLTWGDTEIKRLLNDGYWEFCRITHILRKRANVTITYNTATFAMPTHATVSSILRIWCAEWDDVKLRVMSTYKMDRLISSGWRETTGEDVRYVLTDAGDTTKITIYPMIDTAAHAAEHSLVVDYSYLPVVMSATTDVPAFSEGYHQACVEYAIGMLLEDEVQSKQNPFMGNRAMLNFYRLVAAGKAETNEGLFNDNDAQMIPPNV